MSAPSDKPLRHIQRQKELGLTEAHVQQTVTQFLEHAPAPRYGGERTHRPNTAWDAKDGAVAILLTTPGLIAFVDAADYPLVEYVRWNARISKRSKTVYAYGFSRALRKCVFMHQLILGTVGGPETDHEDGNGLNNRRYNLREASGSQNCVNKDHPKDGFRGISKRGRKWAAKVKHLGKTIHIGTFSTEEEAAAAYDAKARELWGAFARTNF